MKFTIITATLNNKVGLIRAIESVRSQTYKNVEHIIVDGGSTDGTVELMHNVEFRMYNLEFISEPDNGIYDAINKGIKLATGDIIGLLHSDDFYADEYVLERYAEAFMHSAEGKAQRSFYYLSRRWRSEVDAQDDTKLPATHNRPPTTDNRQPIIDAVYSDLVYVMEKSKVKNQKSKGIDRDSKNGSEKLENKFIDNSTLNIEYSIIRKWKTHSGKNSKSSKVNGKEAEEHSPFTIHYSIITNHQLQNGWMPPHPTLFIRREVFDKYGLYRTDMKIAADYEMILRLFWKNKISSAYLPVTTYCMTIGGASNRSLRNILTKSSEDYKAMKIHCLPYPALTLMKKNFKKISQFFII